MQDMPKRLHLRPAEDLAGRGFIPKIRLKRSCHEARNLSKNRLGLAPMADRILKIHSLLEWQSQSVLGKILWQRAGSTSEDFGNQGTIPFSPELLGLAGIEFQNLRVGM